MYSFNHFGIFITQISQPKVRIGTTVLSKSLIWRSSGISKLLARMSRRCMAFLDCSIICFLAFKKLPDLEKSTPRYLYLSVISMLWPPMVNAKLLVLLALNIMIFVLL